MWNTRILSFATLWLIILTIIFTKSVTGAFLLISTLALIAQWEFYVLQERRNGFRIFKRVGLMCGALLFFFSYLDLIHQLSPGVIWASLEKLIIMVIVLGAIIRMLFEKNRSNNVIIIALTLLGFFYIPYLFNFLLKTLFWSPHPEEGIFLCFYLVAVTKFTDVGAFVIGKILGKHKMVPNISPHKTWEGFIGGMLTALLFSFLIIKMTPHKLHILAGHHWWVLGLMLGLLAVIGDLSESALKRNAETKDTGNVIPGIGGVLDLLDSLLFTAPFFYSYLILLELK